jgi:signal transduction histidine kinase
MRRLRLSTLLVAVNVGLLLLAVTGVAIAAARMLQRLADEQALARTSQAAVLARQQIDNTATAMTISAQLLAERPTLRRLLLEQDHSDLNDFLERFQETSHLDGAAVFDGTTMIAQAGTALPWTALKEASASPRADMLVRVAPGILLLGARASVSESPGSEVVVVTLLDESFASHLSSAVGMAVTIIGSDALTGPHAALDTRAIDTDAVASERIDRTGNYAAAVPLHNPMGEIVGVIETNVPTAGVTSSLRQLIVTLGFLTLSVALLAGLISLGIGARLSQPLRRLTGAAARIGHGDLATPVDRAPGREIGTLATTLDEMRARLLRLTDDLRQKQAEAEAVVTGIVEGVFSVDRARRIRYLNPQAAGMLGIAPEAALGRFCGDVLHSLAPPEARPCDDHCPIIHARFRGGARATEHLLLAEDRRRTVIITSAPAMGEAQMQVMRDETDVEASQRLRDTILANISHEFRTPLSAQLASIELLLHQLPEMSTAQIGDLVLAQQRSTLRLMQLIDNLLESARIEAGQYTIRQHPVALDEVVEDALEQTRPLLDQRNQEAVVELPYPLPPVRGDARRLTQVFVNLLGNANKYAPPGTIITIGGETSPTEVTLWVDDQGPGLPAGGQGPWGRFVRAPAGEPEQSGFGLGLSLVKSIVERHGGRVQACNTGTGTRMSITLPVEQS